MTEEEPPTTTATAAAEQALARLTGLARVALQTQASLAKQSVDLARGTLSGDLDRTSAGKAYVEAVSREGARYWRAVGELGIDYATDLVALGKSVSTTVMREMAAAGRKPVTRHTSGATADHTHSTGHHVMPEGGGSQVASSRTSGESSSGAGNQDAGPRRVKVRLRGPVGGRAEGGRSRSPTNTPARVGSSSALATSWTPRAVSSARLWTSRRPLSRCPAVRSVRSVSGWTWTMVRSRPVSGTPAPSTSPVVTKPRSR